MAHNITERDGLFVVREPAWHGLGEVLSEYPTRQEAQAIAHPWEPVSEPVYRKVPFVTETGELGERFEVIEDSVLNVRSDDGFALGVTPASRVTISNSEMYDIAEAIEGTDKGAVKFETGGSLLGGKKVWLLLRLRDPLTIPGDPQGETIPYYGLQNGHSADGGAFRGQATLTRIVCDNTSQMADLDARARGTEFVFKHTKNIRDRIDEAKEALAGWRESVQAYRLLSAHLVGLRVTPAQRELFVTEFVPMPPPHAVSDRVVQNVEDARAAIRDILASPTCVGIDETAYGLVQASVEYLNHARRAKSAETRFKRAYLDRNRITTDAVALAEQVALATV